jgi:hypothetical protein
MLVTLGSSKDARYVIKLSHRVSAVGALRETAQQNDSCAGPEKLPPKLLLIRRRF